MMGNTVSLQGVSKRFGATTVLNAIDLDIRPGEFLTLLGPSGCGKTTLLRAVAGFYTPDAGRICVNGQDITQQPPYLRDIGMVFQSYAVFPHMTVEDNVAYGLKARSCPAAELKQRVATALDKVQLQGLSGRFASELSGGQKQRVGLARALVIEPTMLLMDEPLSNLDAKLRIEMRQEIRLLQRELGITTLYVTHDQEEALAVSDRIAVMQGGRVLQLDAPQSIYQQPSHAFVMDFVGGCNWLDGMLEPDGALRTADGHRLALQAAGVPAGQAVRLGLRHEDLRLSQDPALPGWDGVLLELKTFLGTRTRYRARPTGAPAFEFDVPTAEAVAEEGARVSVRFEARHAALFDATTGVRLPVQP